MKTERSAEMLLRSARNGASTVPTVNSTGIGLAVSAGALAWTAIQITQELDPRERSPAG